MMYKFKYMQGDNTIYHNGRFIGSYEEFMVLNPDFPLREGVFLEYAEGKLDLINSEGHHFSQDDLSPYEELISAINNLGE